MEEDLKDDSKVAMEMKKGREFPSLFYLNRRQLDEYQELTKRQQHLAFVMTWSASVAAFIVLIVGVLAVVNQDDVSGKFIAGGLTALGALLSGFLGKTFFDGHETATRQLNHYYSEPSLTGRLLAAERIIEQLSPNDKSKQAVELITTMLKWQPPTPPVKSPKTETEPPTQET